VIVRFADLLEEARRGGTVVGAFTCYDAESAAGVLRAARGRPVVMLISAQMVSGPDGDLLVAALRGLAEQARSMVCLQLDHAHDLDTVRAGCEMGLGAVMADGSHLSPDANLEFVLGARAIAAPLGVAVEAQLGRLEGLEEIAVAADSGELTNPEDARVFVRETGIDCLGVAIGNVHGIYRGRPHLDLPRLREMSAGVPVPLCLHGGSGLPADCVGAAVAAGIGKVNFNTDLRQAYLTRTAQELARAPVGAALLALHHAQMDAVAQTAAEKLAALTSLAALPR
jgi:tagatose 1,6-diphosphate aldolase GatY/KbaY